MEYLNMTQYELDNIISRGGDKKVKLNQMVGDHLDTLELSEKAQDIIANTSFDCLADIFAGLFTAEEVEAFINETFKDEE